MDSKFEAYQISQDPFDGGQNVKWHSLGDALNLAHNASISAVTLSNNIVPR
jgi:hypothetical protein